MFPHQRALAATHGKELAEERRLAYVGITRARQRLYISRAIVRSAWGTPQHNPPSRFLTEVPDHLVDWRRTGERDHQLAQHLGDAQPTARRLAEHGRLRRSAERPRGARRWLPGTGCCTPPSAWARWWPPRGDGGKAMADVDFGSAGVKRLSLRHAPLEKL